jgi:hypothetical protein
MLILMLICVFLILCLLYGMYASARSVARGAGHIRSHVTPNSTAVAPAETDLCAPLPKFHACYQSRIEELRSLFALYQSGVLTQAEFEQTKRHLLAKMTALS